MTNPYLSLLRQVWQQSQARRLPLLWIYFSYIVAQICLSISPYAFGRMIDALQRFKPGKYEDIIFWTLIGIALIPIFWLFHGPARVLERKLALRIYQSFFLEFYDKLTLLPLKWHQDNHSGKIITQLTRSANSLRRFAENQFIYVENLIKFAFSISFLFWLSLPVGVLSALLCGIAAISVILFDKRLIPLYESENTADNNFGTGIFDYISNIITVQTLRLARLTYSNLFYRLSLVWPAFNKEAVLNETKWFIVAMFLSLAQSSILICYIFFHIKSNDVLLIGTVVMIFRYQLDLNDVFYNLSMHYSELVRMDTDVRNIQPIVNDLHRLARPTPGYAVAMQWHTIRIQELSFTHPKEQSKKAINSLNLKIKRGEKIALIGYSGSGKSTLLKLLSGLYEADKVKLTIDEVNFNSLEPLHAVATLIPQDPEIFENTIAFNITLGLETEQKFIDDVVNLACFTPVLEQLPLQLATEIREKGSNLSGGQKQRLALARGLFAARFSSLILMDEPTSSIDLITEERIFKNILQYYPDKTLIVSLHRLHLLPRFDRIIMLDQGNSIADDHSHTLLSLPGPVREIWQKYQTQA